MSSPQYYSGPKHLLPVGQRLMSCFPAAWGEVPNSEPSPRISLALRFWSCQVASSEGAGPQLVQVSVIFLQPCVPSLVPGFLLGFCSSTCSDCSCPKQPQAAVSSPIDIKQDEIPVTSKVPVSLCLPCLLCFLSFILWTVFGGCACPWL